MIEVRAEDAAARQLPPIGFSLDARAAGMEARLFAQPGQYLIASGPPGAPLLFVVWTAAPGGAAALAQAVQARFGGPNLVVGEASTLELAGARQPALAFSTGAGMWTTAWCGVLVETPSGALFVAFGFGSQQRLSCAQVAGHPSLSRLVRSFTLGGRAQAKATAPAAYAPAIGIVEDDFGPKFQLPVPKSTVAIRGWQDALIGKASLPRALGALLGLAVGGARGGGGVVPAGVRLASAIADVFLEQGVFSTGTLAVRYLDLRREFASSVGEQAQQALDLIARGCPAERAGRLVWEKRGRAPDDASVLARTAIFGVLFAGQPSVRRTLSFTEAAITHFDPCSQLAAAALNAAIGHALTARPSPASMLRAAQDEVRDGAAAMRELYPDLAAEIERAEAALRDDLAAAREGEAQAQGDTSPVRAALRLAFFELVNGGDFASALDDVAARPGDVASHAAIAGALLGAFYGAGAIPPDAVEAVLRGGGAPPPAERADFHPRAFLRVLARGFGADRDPDVIAQLAPYVARAFPLCGALERIPGPELAIGDDWRVTEWLRGSPACGQARCRRGTERAIATFAMAWTERVADPAAGVPCVAPLLSTSTILHDGKSIAVMLEAQPAGIPLSTPALPLRGRQALPVFAQLVAVLQVAAERGVVLAGLRPEGIYVVRGASGMVLSGILPRADRFLVDAAKPGLAQPFATTHAAPEVARGGELTPAADVFSACSVFVYLTQRRSIYEVGAADPQRPPNELVELPGALDKSVEDALRAGLDLDPRKRPTVADLASVLAAAHVSVAQAPAFVPAPTEA